MTRPGVKDRVQIGVKHAIAEKRGIAQIPHVGDRVRHFTGSVGTVIFVQRDAPGTQSHEHIRVRWDNNTGVAPHLAAEYTLISAEEPLQADSLS